MVEEIIKQRLHDSGEEGSEPLGRHGTLIMLKQRNKDTCLQGSQVAVSALEHLGIEAELIPKVLKEQANVVARSLRNRVDACPIEAMFCEGRFRRIQNDLTCQPSITRPSSFASRFSHAILPFPSHTLLLSKFLLR